MSAALSSTITARLQNPETRCPAAILRRQRIITVRYWGFDGKLHAGRIVLDKRLTDDVSEVFAAMRAVHFPLASVIPISDRRFRWSDAASMAANNSSAFNYRTIAGTSKLSLHALGQALDINPALNPYIHDGVIDPPGATYDTSRPGTISEDSFIVKMFEERGWEWGGRWTGRRTDYQHFQKPLDLL